MPPTSIPRSFLRPNFLLNPSNSSSPLIHARHESSYRRHVKRQSLPPAPSFTNTPSSPTSSHIIFNPPPTSPNVYHTPLKFLPANDKRRQLYASAPSLYSIPPSTRKSPTAFPVTKPGTALHESTSSLPSALLPRVPEGSPLPPALKPPVEKKYHLTEEDVAEIRRLRMDDPKTWSRDKLAEKFGCSSFFIGVVVKNEEAGKAHERRMEEVRSKWGPRKRDARAQRVRRKELWGRDA